MAGGNPNHDAKTGEFTSGAGGGPRQNPNAGVSAHEVHASIKKSLPKRSRVKGPTIYSATRSMIVADH
jgi:hypothetical protein